MKENFEKGACLVGEFYAARGLAAGCGGFLGMCVSEPSLCKRVLGLVLGIFSEVLSERNLPEREMPCGGPCAGDAEKEP